MKWKADFVQELDTTYHHRFAWFPVLLDDGNYIWLEWYWKSKQYTSRPYFNNTTPPDNCGIRYQDGGQWYERNSKRAKTKDGVMSPIDNYYRNQKNNEYTSNR